MSTLLGQGTPKREKPLFWKFDSPWPAPENKPDHWVSYAVVDQHWKLVANRDCDYVELYEISAEPYERNDLKEEQPEVVKALKKKIPAWRMSLPEKPPAHCFSKLRTEQRK